MVKKKKYVFIILCTKIKNKQAKARGQVAFVRDR